MIDVSRLIIPGIDNLDTLTCISRARRFSQYCQMVRDAQTGKCPFCKLDPNYNKVILENAHWYLWQSSSPEKHTKHHFIIVPKRHITGTSELSEREVLSLFIIMNAIKRKHGITSCGILIRDGDARIHAPPRRRIVAYVQRAG